MVITGVDDIRFATMAVQQGAQDYLVKGSITHSLLIRSLLYAIERKRTEERLLRLNEELEKRVAERTRELTDLVERMEGEIAERKRAEQHKDEFVSMVSHELRTPLSIVKEGIDLLLARIPGEVNQKQTHVLNVAARNIARLGRIINNLLDVSQIEAGRMRIKLTPLDFCQVLHDIRDSFRQGCRDKGLRLEVSCENPPIMVNADSDALTEVLDNLVGNAVKFTKSGGIRVHAWKTEDSVVCSVADTGVGIREDAMDRIFDKFEQFHRDSNPDADKGTGLGLTITKHIVEMHGGTIRVKSAVDQGTEVTFTLPKFQ